MITFKFFGVFFLTIIYTVLQVISISIYFNEFMNLKIKKIYFNIFVFIFAVLIKLIPNDINSISRLLLFLTVLGIIISFSFYGSFARKIYHTIYYTLIATLADLILSITVQNIAIGSNQILITSFIANYISLLIIILSILVLACFKDDNDMGLNNTEYLLLGIIPCLSLVFVYSIIQLDYIWQLISTLFILIINICVSILYNQLINKNFILYKYSMIEAQNLFYKENLKGQKELRQLKHDLKNLLVNFAYHLEHEQVDQVDKQIQELLKTNALSSISLTGCLPLDAILHSTLEKIKKHDIEHSMDLQVPSDMEFQNEVDVIAILGNLLDNAIEAVLRLPVNKEKKITISMKYNKEKLFIYIVNSTNYVDLNSTNGIPLSEKRNNEFGIGITSIKDRVTRLKGYYDFSYDSGFFEVLIILPIK